MRMGWAERLILTMGYVCVSAIIVLVLVGLFKAAGATDPTPTPVSQIGPDISHCFDDGEGRDLWDCIRNEGEDQ
jgi:hypothetical protein